MNEFNIFVVICFVWFTTSLLYLKTRFPQLIIIYCLEHHNNLYDVNDTYELLVKDQDDVLILNLKSF